MKTNYNNTDEQIIQMLTPKVNIKPSAELRERILKAAAEQQNTTQQQNMRPRQSRLSYWIGAVASVAAVVAIAITFTLNSPAYAARKYFSNALITLQDATTMVMKLSVRTAPDEPIDYINPAMDFIPATVKVIYGEPMLWSIEKRDGRSVLYKGADDAGDIVYQWINGKDSSTGWKQQHEGYVTGDLEIMLDPRMLLEAEHRTAQRNKGTKYEILDLGEVAIVRVATTAQGDFSESDYMLNTSLAEANTIREYTFAKGSGLLYKMRIVTLVDKKPVTVIESESIIFNEPLEVDDLYNKEVFDNVSFINPELKPTQSTSPLVGISADKAAKIILEAMGSWDMDILGTALHYFGDAISKVEQTYKGLEVKSIGKPFKSGLYAGQFVKCKVILANGEKEELILALRNDNKQKIWLLDGGI